MQPHNYTGFNRYPYLWERIKDEKPKNILSYGCSTGEEAVTAQGYFPESYVLGYDNNPVMIRIARLRFPTMQFTEYEIPVSREGYTCDIILCNSVLCNHPKNFKADKNEVMAFDQFATTVKELDARLNTGGILMLMNAEYILSDVLDYKPIGIKVNHKVAVFDKNGNRTSHKQYALWRKP